MPSPIPDKKRDRRVALYRKKGLSFRDISKLTGEDLKSVYRRYKRVGKLSTRRLLTVGK